ncbi:MAG TPA: hypothetical protein VGS97_04885 [Actinocrinis sp.]|uniref:hypothetical protein n=1 Tax=Actinocrinis sp. TaxID=1920516 RepID=UPI002DDCC986|nr:hypothetical protein [Actinocrinis sp.]HEV2343407.1 hypothetical protein [Actinocrinis sp.]
MIETDVWPIVIPSSLGLRVLSYARWPETEDDTLPPIPGFIVSSFNPLVAEVADRCLRRRTTRPAANVRREPTGSGTDDRRLDDAQFDDTGFSGTALDGTALDGAGFNDTGFDDAAAPARTALLLASVGGDRATAQAIAEAVRSGRRVPPLLFFQSNPNAVLGHIAARRRLTGPVVCVSPPPDSAGGITADALTEADWLLRDGDADEVLLIAAEQGARPGEGDRAEAVLVDRRP